jgi:hypothetical protein
MLVGILILCAALTYLASLTATARRQANAVQALKHMGATVTYDFHFYYHDGPSINRSRKPSDWVWARKLLGDDFFSNVYRVEFVQQRWWPSKSGLVHGFGPVPTATPISREADKYIHLLQELPNLQSLDLSNSAVSDNSGPALARLQCLKCLSLNETAISDRSIPVLAKLRNLKDLVLANTAITRQGFEKLRTLLPNCEIYWRPRAPR